MVTFGNRKWLIVVCLAVALAALVAISYFIPIQYDICTKDEYTGQKECAAYHITPFIFLYIGEYLEAHNGTVTAIATGSTAWFTFILYRATTQQSRITNAALELARDEFNATHRPKLSVRRMKPHLDKPVGVHYVIVNIGETTAIIKRHEFTLCIQSANRGAKPTQQRIPLQCRQLKRGESRPFLTNIDAEYDFAWGIAADSCITIRGIIEYEDGVGTMRRTGFLRTYDAKLGRFHASDDKEYEYED